MPRQRQIMVLRLRLVLAWASMSLFAAAVACPGAPESFCIPLPSEQSRLQADPFRLWTAQLAVAGTRRGAIHSNRCCGRKPATLAFGTSCLLVLANALVKPGTRNILAITQEKGRTLWVPPPQGAGNPSANTRGLHLPVHPRSACLCVCCRPCLPVHLGLPLSATTNVDGESPLVSDLLADSAEALPPGVMACRTTGHDCGLWLGLGPIFFLGAGRQDLPGKKNSGTAQTGFQKGPGNKNDCTSPAAKQKRLKTQTAMLSDNVHNVRETMGISREPWLLEHHAFVTLRVAWADELVSS